MPFLCFGRVADRLCLWVMLYHRQVRIFGYNVGFGAEFINTLHWLSCENKGFYNNMHFKFGWLFVAKQLNLIGYYSMINALADVKLYSRVFLPVLSRPLALALRDTEPKDRPVSYTGPYMDAQVRKARNWSHTKLQDQYLIVSVSVCYHGFLSVAILCSVVCWFFFMSLLVYPFI